MNTSKKRWSSLATSFRCNKHEDPDKNYMVVCYESPVVTCKPRQRQLLHKHLPFADKSIIPPGLC